MPHTQQSVVDLSIEIPQFESLEFADCFLFQSVDGFGVVLHRTDQNTNRKHMVMVITTMAL